STPRALFFGLSRADVLAHRTNTDYLDGSCSNGEGHCRNVSVVQEHQRCPHEDADSRRKDGCEQNHARGASTPNLQAVFLNPKSLPGPNETVERVALIALGNRASARR